jgi:transcriptional regulator with XRE-family HTH domain
MPDPICPTCRASWSDDHRCVTGAQLAKERIAHSRSQRYVAEALGVSQTAVYKRERAAIVQDARVREYRAALG